MEQAVSACRYDFQDGSNYTGAVQDGAASGLGVYRGSSGRSSYAGSWRKGFEESGVYSWPESNYYQGQWLQGRKHGLGVEWLRGWLYKGEWTQGFRGRYGVRQNTKSGAKYEGSWTFGFQDGYGIETYADGGTYQGQWLRGMRHGYGVRESVSYDLALRYHRQPNSTSLPNTPQEPPAVSFDDPTITSRDRRIEEGHAGGFVLHSETTPGGRDRGGKSSIQKALKFIRQKSAGDIDEADRSSKGARTTGGSVRSTVSTGRKSSKRVFGKKEEAFEEEDEWGSFVSIVNATFQEDIVERYWGEWKNDRRSGYGVCERSDGVKYEGEWLNNTKNGYGIITLRDGTRIEGKFKKNVLLTSSTDGKMFFTRTARLKELIDRSVNEAVKAAGIAKEKAEISNVRTASARVKAEQAEMEAGRAESLAQAATAQAQKCFGNVSQPGTQIFMNHLPEDNFASTTSDVPIANAQPKTPSKILGLFRPKTRDMNPKKATIAELDSSLSRDQNTAQFYATTGNTMVRDGRYSQNPWPGNATVPRNFDYTGSGKQDGRNPRGILGAPQAKLSDEFFKNPQVPFRQEVGGRIDTMQNFETNISSALIDGNRRFDSPVGVSGMPLSSTQLGNQFASQTSAAEYRPTTPLGRRSARAEIDAIAWQLPSLSPVSSSGDVPIIDPRSAERRKSLPSIVKDELPSSKKQEVKTIKSSITSSGGVAAPEKKTFVIVDGVRKQVTPVYGPRSPVRTLAVEGRSGLPKLYNIESPGDGRGRGSVPDVTAVGGIEIMSRETAYALSQQRREELMRERKANETRGGQIVLRLGDVTDWCARRKMLIVVLAVNYALVTVFYNMIQQQD